MNYPPFSRQLLKPCLLFCYNITMSKNKYTKKELQILSLNSNITSSSPIYIKYAEHFITEVLHKKKEYTSNTQIFKEAGLSFLSKKKGYIVDLVKGWIKRERKGELFRKKGRPVSLENSDVDYELRIKYLEEENAFLRKLRAQRAEK